MKKVYLYALLLMMLMPKFLSAQTSYEINDYIVEATLDISGNMKVREIIRVDGSYDSFTRNIMFRNSKLPKFTGLEEDFRESDIYNAGNVIIYHVGTIEYKGALDFDAFSKEIHTSDSSCVNKTGCYKQTQITDGVSIKMFNDEGNSETYYYIEYLLGNIVVLHEDIAELYYNFIDSSFNDNINKYKLRLILPNLTSDEIKLWVHGAPDGKVSFLKNENSYYGGYLEMNNIPQNTPITMRILFPKNLINVDHYFLKKSNVEAYYKILLAEEKVESETRPQRVDKSLWVVYTTSVIYILLTLSIIVYIYIKYDREIKARFKSKYYKEFITDYDVTHIEYLFKKNITEVSFSTSILNMIYKGNIEYKKMTGNNFELTLVNEDGLNNSESQIINILFENGKTTSLEEIKNYNNSFIESYDIWASTLMKEARKNKFFIDNQALKMSYALYSLLGFMVILIHTSVKIFNYLTFSVFVLTLIFIIYIVFFTKRTRKGTEHYAKWKSFKHFLDDFEKFNEKKLPPIELWEKYLVYASIFQIEDKVSISMINKSQELGYSTLIDINTWKQLSDNIHSTVAKSLKNAQEQIHKNK